MAAIPTTSNQYTFTSYLDQLPANFKKLLLQNLKKNVASGKLVKVKASFKLSAAAKKPAVAKPKTKPAAKAKAVKAKTAAKPKSAAIKPKPAAKSKAAVKPKSKAKPAKVAKYIKHLQNETQKLGVEKETMHQTYVKKTIRSQ